MATPKPQGLRVEWDVSQQCNYQDKGAWGLVRIEVISYVLETRAVHSMTSLCWRKCSLFVGIPTIIDTTIQGVKENSRQLGERCDQIT